MIPAIHDATHTKEFCGSINTEDAIVIKCAPVFGKPENECFPIVEEYITSHGGELVIGWAIWERPKVFIEAEFHAVWRSDSGECIDIVTRNPSHERITFLPDPNRKYTGLQVDNIRKPLIKDKDVIRYLFLFKRMYEVMNTGDLANQHGMIALPERLMREYMKLAKEAKVLHHRLEKRYPD